MTARGPAAAAALLALLVMAACTGDADDTTTAPSTTAPSTTALPSTTTTTAAPTTTTTVPAGLAVPVIRSPVTGEVFYFIMTDRFANGDPGNDRGGRDGDDPLLTGYLPTDTGYYHGGDLAGIAGHLDYIAGLGATSLWITPPFTNRVVQGNGTVAGSSAGYHGYWQVDFTTVDPHLGTNADLRALVAAAHERGMKVYLDAVTNHTGDVIRYEEGVYAYVSRESEPYRDASGEPFDETAPGAAGDFPDLDPAVSFPYTPVFADEGDAAVKAPDWLDDPIYYHNRGDSSFHGESSRYGDFFGLDDLFTEHPVVREGMTGIYAGIVTEFGVDGFRVDTAKHVDDEFWLTFLPGLATAADEAGIGEFFVFGEVFGESPAFRGHYTTALDFPSLLDFGFNDTTIAYAATGAPAAVVEDLFDSDDWYTDEDSNASLLVKFTGNHDIGRIGHFIQTARPGSGPAEQVGRMELALELMFLTRGIPLVYYGDEQGFTGSGGDQLARQDMFPSVTPEYLDDDLIGTPATTAGDNFDPDARFYRHVAALAEMRAAHPALVTGAQITRLAEEEPGVFAYSRIDRGERVEYLVAHNNVGGARRVAVRVATPGAAFASVYGAGADTVAASPDGIVDLVVPGWGSVVYRADGPVPPPGDAPQVRITRPEAGSALNLPRYRIEAELDRPVFAEVTFAVSLAGGEYAVLGTDDAAPYRVYWDNSALPDGTAVEVMATVDDLTGGRSVATVSFSLGARESLP